MVVWLNSTQVSRVRANRQSLDKPPIEDIPCTRYLRYNIVWSRDSAIQ